MKNKILILCILFCSVIYTYGQNSKANLENTIKTYIKISEALNFDETIEYVYPKLFDIVPKDALLANLKSSTSDTSIKLKLYNFKTKNISDIIKIDSIEYAYVQYSFTMTIKVEGMEDNAEFMSGIYKQMYGENNVTYDSTTQKYIINVDEGMFAINNPEYKSWKFLTNKKELREIMKSMLPEAILNKW